MHASDRTRPGSVAALLVTALGLGAFVGLVTACFIWLLEQGTALVWTDLPDAVGVAPYDSWWLFAVPIVGGALVGIGQRVLGSYPEPIDAAMETWREGGQLEPVAAPKTAVNSLIALVMGGPVGFEAALIGVIGGTASWISRPIGTVRQLVREAWGADRVESVPRAVRQLPSWLAALSGLLTYHWLPFGSIDLGFRFQQFDGTIGVADGLAVFALAAAVVVPAAWAISVVMRAEHATFARRSPVLIGMAGGVVFACMAVGNDLVLFSGQQGIQLLPDESTGALVYIAIAKWLALVVALVAGWRGGPIFPTYTAVAAIGVLVDQVVGVGPDLMMIAAIAAVSVVFLKGNIPLAALLTLYPVPLSYAGVILVGCVGGAVGLAVGRSFHALPSPSEAPPPATA